MARRSLDEITKGYFSDIRERVALNRTFSGESMDSMYESADLYKSAGVLGHLKAESSKDVAAPEEYTYQTALRPWFNKPELNQSKVGPHPDFAHLKASGDVEFHHIVTMFVDIKRSSRLSLLMPLQHAYVVKNRILQACVDVIRAMDGYPHRLMGDAVMAFFGDKKSSSEDAIADALNAASLLKLILTESVFPELNQWLNKDVNLGVRIGLDYGSTQEVIWANYGYGEASEVTALGLPVDLASKAQSQAKTNTAMLGQGILEHIDFPEFYSEVKIITKGGESVPEQYILPNMTDENGKPINRRCKLLKMGDYQNLLPIPADWKSHQADIKNNDSVTYKCFYRESDDDYWKEYKSASFFLEKGMSLKFEFVINNPSLFVKKFPLVAKYVKVNHGLEARNKAQEGPEIKDDIIINYDDIQHYSPIVNELAEGTSYRGLHTMQLTIAPKNEPYNIIYRNIIGVYIK